MKRFVFFIMMIAIMSGCAKIPYSVPMSPKVEPLEGRKIPLEAALLITPEAKGRIFRSPDYPNFMGQFVVYGIEPYQLPVGEAFEKACLETFLQIFEKVTLIRKAEEGKNYRLVIEPQLNDFYLDLFYTNTGSDRLGIYSEIVDEKCQVKVSGTLKSYGRTIWERPLETPMEKLQRVNNFQLRNQVAAFASDTIVEAVKMLADQIIQESQTPPPAKPFRNWMEQIGPNR
jgi:hypothetical protein